MSLNLKPILTTQTDNEKLDAINYNFDQIVANGGGPMGTQGATGPQGLDGLTGAQGIQGASGAQGVQGPKGDAATNYWKINPASVDNETLVPIHDAGITNPPTVMFGIDKLDPLYDEVFNDAAVVINRKSSAYGYNLFLTDDGVTTSDNNKFGFRLFQDGSITKFELGFANTSNSNPTQWQLFADGFEFTDGTNNFVEILNTGFNVNVPATFSQPTTFQNTVKINSGNPADGKLLVATDSQGTTTWKAVNEIGGVVPVGTIVPILTSIFDDTNNFYKDAETWGGGASEVLKIRHGRGKGDYKGWYLCNGRTWTDGNGQSRLVPDLSSFDYDIAAASGTGQGAATHTNSKLAIIGGANVEFLVDYNSGYSFDDTITNTTESIYTAGSGSTQYDLTKLVFVIYLGEDGWYWQDSGVTSITHYYALYKSISTAAQNGSVHYTSSPASTYAANAAPGTSGYTFTITLTPNSGYQFTSTSNVALYTAGDLFGWTRDTSVSQSSATINQAGQLVLTLSDSSFPTVNGGLSTLQIIGDAVGSTTGTGLSVKRSTTGFQGNNASAWSNVTVYVSSGSTLASATYLYADSGLSTSATPGWYAYSSNGTTWTYRYWGSGQFGTTNMQGVSTAPGSWYSVSGDSAMVAGGVGNFPAASATYNACTSPISPTDIATSSLWATVSSIAGMADNASCWVVGFNTTGNANSVNFVDHATYGIGYLSYSPCYKMWSYAYSTGILSRSTIACASYSSAYDDYSGTGVCTGFSGGTGS